MRIGYDATSLTGPRTGIGRYTLELLRAMRAQDPGLEFVLMAHRDVARDLRHNGLAAIPRLRGPDMPARLPWLHGMLPVQLAASRVEVCHFTNYQAPIMTGRPTVMTLHDMSLLLYPDGHPAHRVATMRPLLRAVARRATAVITLTESAKRDAVSVLSLDPERIHVVPAAPAASFRPIQDAAALAGVAARHGLEPGFLLYVGTIEPRKNLERLVEAFAALRRDGFGHPLVLAGSRGWKEEGLLRRIDALGPGASVRLIGYVPDDELPALMNVAGAFVYPSLYEGFGLPIVEALACGTPTVTSDRGAMAEVAGDAALLADPEDTEALRDALAVALHDEPTRRRLREAGPRRAAAFDWGRAARDTVGVYRRALGAAR
jgi:glycosyltransferase involved in cell wall biosynthesis